MKKGDPLGFINILSVAKYQKIRRGDSFEKLKIFEKKFAQCRKKLKWGPFGVFRFCRLRKKGKKRKGGPFAVSLHWWNLAWVNLSVSVKKWYIRDELCGLTKKKKKKLATATVGLFSLKENAPTKKRALRGTVLFLLFRLTCWLIEAFLE